MKQSAHSKLDAFDKIIKIIYFLGLIVWNAFLIIVIGMAFHETYLQGPIPEGGPESNIGYAFTFLILGIIYGGIGNAVLVVIAVVGFIVAVCNKKNPKRMKRILSYIVMIFLPIMIEGLIILSGLYLPELIL